jgi:hypothetical protein
MTGSIVVTGQIDRVTDFDNGFPIRDGQGDGAWDD